MGSKIPRLTKIPIEEAKGIRKRINRKAEQLEKYKGLITALEPTEAGKLKIDTKKDDYSIRAGLKRAAKSLGLDIKVQKRENHIYFWIE